MLRSKTRALLASGAPRFMEKPTDSAVSLMDPDDLILEDSKRAVDESYCDLRGSGPGRFLHLYT